MTSMVLDNDVYDIIIMGDGIIGKSAALSFAQQHLRIALITLPKSHNCSRHRFYLDANKPKLEQTKPIFTETDSRIYAISKASKKLFQQLKIWQNFPIDILTPVMDIDVFGDTNGLIKFSAYQASITELCWIVPSFVIHDQLTSAINFHNNISVIEGTVLKQNVQDDYVFINLEIGKKIAAKLIIGADGAESWVRKQGNFRLSRIDYGQSAIIANFKATFPHKEKAIQWFFDAKIKRNNIHRDASSEILAFLPMSNNHISIVWSAEKKHAQQLMEMTIAKFTEELIDVSNNTLGPLKITGQRKCFPLVQQNVNKLIDKRTVLIGDAAHVIHPLAGQGLNLGLKDIAMLSKFIRERSMLNDCGEQSILNNYQRSRLEDIKKINFLIHSIQKIFSIDHPLARFFRNTGMSFISQNSFLKNWLISQAIE